MPPPWGEPELAEQYFDFAGVLSLEFDEIETGRRFRIGERGEVQLVF